MLEALHARSAIITGMKNPHAVALGRLGGLKGGPLGGRARAAALSPRRRKDIARRAAAARWGQLHEPIPSRDGDELRTVGQIRTWLAEAGAPLMSSDSGASKVPPE